MAYASASKITRSIEDVIADARQDMQRREAIQKAAVAEALTKMISAGVDNHYFPPALHNNTTKPQIIFDLQIRPGSRSAPPPSTRGHKSSKSQRHPDGEGFFGEPAVSTPVHVEDASRSRNVGAPTSPTTTSQSSIELELMQPGYSPAEDKLKYIESHRMDATAVDIQDPKWEAWMLRMLLKHKMGVDDSAVNEYLTFMHFECLRLKEQSRQSMWEGRDSVIAQQRRARHAARQPYEQQPDDGNVRNEMRYLGQSKSPWFAVNRVVQEAGHRPHPDTVNGRKRRC